MLVRSELNNELHYERYCQLQLLAVLKEIDNNTIGAMRNQRGKSLPIMKGIELRSFIY